MKRISSFFFIVLFTGILFAQANQNIEFIKDIYYNNEYNDSKILDNYAYIGTNEKFLVYDVTDKANPIFKSSVDFNKTALRLTTSGDRVLVAGGPSGLMIFNASTRTAPYLEKTITTFDSTLNSIMLGNRLLITDFTGGLRIFNYSDPINPQFLVQLDSGKYCTGTAVSSNSNYIFNSLAGEEISVYNANTYQKVASIPTPGTLTFDLVIKDSILYVADYFNGVKLYNISDPLSPQFVTTMPGTTGASYLTLKGNQLFVSKRTFLASKLLKKIKPLTPMKITANGLDAYNLTNPTSPVLNYFISGSDMNVSNLEGNYLYVTNSISFTIYDILTGSPVKQSVLESFGSINYSLVSGNYLYVGTSKAGLAIFNIPQPDSLVLISKYTAAGAVYGFAKSGNRIYLACDKSLEIINVVDPSAPVKIGNFDFLSQGYRPTRVAVSGDTIAFLAGGDLAGLSMLNITNLNNIVETDRHGFGPLPYSSFSDVTCRDSLVYSINNSTGFFLFAIQPDYKITLKTNIGEGGFSGIDLKNSIAYFAQGTAGLQLINVVNPINPIPVSIFATNGDARSVKLLNNYAFISNGFAGLDIVDISNINIPFRVGRYNTGGNASHLDIKSDYIYLADKSSIGIYKFNINMQPSVLVHSPNGGETWPSGTIHSIEWVASNIQKVNIDYTTNNGTSWISVASNLNSSPSAYSWTIPNTPSVNCKVRISDFTNASLFDISDNIFTISALAQPSIPTLAIPANADSSVGNSVLLVWLSANNATSYQVQMADNPLFSAPLAIDSVLTSTSVSYSGLVLGKTYYWRVLSKNIVGNSSWSEVWSFKVKSVIKPVAIINGWNLVSVPVFRTDMSKTSFFPTASSNAFGYDNGYIVKDTLKNGAGYWIKFDSAFTTQAYGFKVSSTSTTVKEGWNLIGPFESDIQTSAIVTNPSGIITSQFFGYNGGYNQATTLVPGKGYWIKVSANGTLNYPTSLVKAASSEYASSSKDDMIKIVITDKNLRTNVLYLSKNNINTTNYEMPPVPPADIADVRFASNKYVDNIAINNIIQMKSLDYPVTVKAIGKDVIIKDMVNGSIINQLVKDGSSLTITNSSINSINITGISTPLTYSLSQNYPNPFNPATMIKFSIPEKNNVKLVIYDQLGQEVAKVVDQQLEAGNHQFEFNAAKLSSGVYFYRIEAGDFKEVKKMLMLK